MRTVLLTSLAILAFAANGVLARLALAGGGIDPIGFTGVRMTAGAAVLVAATMRIGQRTAMDVARSGTWFQAGALFVYAITASLSYALVNVGIGAIVLFGTVQVTTIVQTIARGERPGALVWLGLVIAFAALVYLVSPSLAAPDPLGVALAFVSGLGWASYSLSGHSSNSPLLETSGNFLRIAPISIILAVVGLSLHTATPTALLVAILCGAMSTGMGYAIWYAVLPVLTRMQASIVQLTVPAIAAVGAVPIVGEPLTLRFAFAAAVTIGGVGVAIVARHRVARTP